MAIDIEKMSAQQLAALMVKAQQQQAQLAVSKVTETRKRIQALLDAEGLSLSDVFDGRSLRGATSKMARGTKGTKSAKRAAPNKNEKSSRVGKVKKNSSSAKYRNPKDATQTWVGRGKRPDWFNAAIKSGKTEKDLLAK